MALVDYGSSADEDDSISDEKNENQTDNDYTQQSETQIIHLGKIQADAEKNGSSKQPPTPDQTNQDISWHYFSKNFKKLNKIKIFAPEIPEEDPDDKVKKQLKHSVKGSSLLSLLPKPKTECYSTLLRSSVSEKNSNAQKPSTLIPDAVLKKAKSVNLNSTFNSSAEPPASLKLEYSDSEEDGETKDVGFFSFCNEASKEDTKPNLCPAISPVSQINSFEDNEGNISQVSTADNEANQITHLVTEQLEIAMTSNTSDNSLKLNDEAMTILCGSKAKRRKQDKNIQFIDVNCDNFIAQANEWHTKELTKIQKIPSHKRSHGPTTQQRRKHQITYLAYQAKEQEQELINQWSNNRMTRKQTQAKYGF